MTRLEKLEELARAVDAWCAAKCPFRSRPPGTTRELCDGANHLEGCPVELALQDVLEASKELQRP